MTAMTRTPRAAAALGGTLVLLLTGAPREAGAQDSRRAGITVEAASVWSARNDVRIPPATGTEFSIPDLIGAGPTGALRVEAAIDLTPRHGLRLVYAPLRVSGRGVSAGSIVFEDGRFLPGAVDAEYQFDSYRATYRYRFFDGPTWQWRAGFTGFVRDARIALAQAGVTAENTDVGFVPLAHVSGEATLSPRWRLRLELDGSAAPQGRAFDALAAIDYRPTPRLTISGGYRTIEGGADVDEVYTFAWLNAFVMRIGVGF